MNVTSYVLRPRTCRTHSRCPLLSGKNKRPTIFVIACPRPFSVIVLSSCICFHGLSSSVAIAVVIAVRFPLSVSFHLHPLLSVVLPECRRLPSPLRSLARRFPSKRLASSYPSLFLSSPAVRHPQSCPRSAICQSDFCHVLL